MHDPDSREGTTSLRSVEDCVSYAPPRRGSFHWQDGRSAKELAKAWCRTEIPTPAAEFWELLSSVADFRSLHLEQGWAEHRVRFDGIRGEPRNTDLAIVGTSQSGKVAISIEAKADESFGRHVGAEILAAATKWAYEESDGKLLRLQRLASLVLPHPQLGGTGTGSPPLSTPDGGRWARGRLPPSKMPVLPCSWYMSSCHLANPIDESERMPRI